MLASYILPIEISEGGSRKIIFYQSHLQSRHRCRWRIAHYLLPADVTSSIEVSEYTAGEADINKKIFPKENQFFVVHNSRGYGSGETENFRKLTEFIGGRTGNDNVGDWLTRNLVCTILVSPL